FKAAFATSVLNCDVYCDISFSSIITGIISLFPAFVYGVRKMGATLILSEKYLILFQNSS
ncbi:MAG: hypothetical protein PUD12_07885, partial [Firmicutes bacterium]|nr:hypothetical protein [Bacillota bacterium]